MIPTLKFYGKLSSFSVKEEHSSLSATVAGLILYPCFVWIFSKLWLGLNHDASILGTAALFAYIGLTEILFMTSLREPFIDRANSDFALSFVRPRVWPIYTSVSIFSRTLFRRLVYLVLYIGIVPLFVEGVEWPWIAAGRFILFLPLVTALESMYSFLLTCMQIRFHSIKNFRLLFGKFFLIFGGVLAPLCDLPDRWQALFINTPFSDLIFQPCYFCVMGTFHQLTSLEWLTRIFVQIACVYALSYFVYRAARKHYHNFGG